MGGRPKPFCPSQIYYFIGLLKSHITKEQNKHKANRLGLGAQTRGGLESSSLPLQSLEPACVISQSLKRGLSSGSISAGADERLTTDWLNTFPPRPLWPRITQFAQSLLPARCRGMHAQRETTLLRWSPALGAEGGEFRDHTSLWPLGKNQGKKGAGAAS